MGTEDGTEIERPVHQVSLTAFFMDRYEVTNKEYETFQPEHQRSPYSACDQCPITNVRWHEADAYCRSRGKRLPTEAEWEKAARGQEGHDYSFGPSADPKRGNFARPRQAGAKEVSGFQPNGYALYHMSGNVWEWVNDWFDPDYYQSSPTQNPTGPDQGRRKVVRGGSWYSPAYYVHAGMRFKLAPKVKLNSIGFRCARTP